MTDNDFDTQRTELANRFASAGAEFLGQMPLAAAALAEVPNTQPQQYAMVGEPKAIRALLPSDDMPARRMRHGQRPTEPLEWEPSAIANKAEVGCERDDGLLNIHPEHEFCEVCTSPATTGASTVLTDERIIDLMEPELLKGDGGYLADIFPEYVIAAGRAIEREVAAQAGQVAVPEDLARDAARYRYLRNSDAEARAPYIVRDTNNKYFGPSWLEGSRADEAIDTAMGHATSSPVKEQK